MAKGYRGAAHKTYSMAMNRVEKALQYAYRDRKVRRREFRVGWIQSINAATRQYSWSYSKFIPALHSSGSLLNRKSIAAIASHEPFSFKALVDVLELQKQQKNMDSTSQSA
jgi:large subunit ribosomal protein L20